MREGKGQSQLLTLEEARANYYDAFQSDKAAPPLNPGVHTFEDWDLSDLREYFDWTPFFRAWELHGTYPKILDDDVVGEAARNLKADAEAMLDKIVAEQWLTAKGVCGFWPCARDGDDVTIHRVQREEHIVLPFLRPAGEEEPRPREYVPRRLYRSPQVTGSAVSRSASTGSRSIRSGS